MMPHLKAQSILRLIPSIERSTLQELAPFWLAVLAGVCCLGLGIALGYLAARASEENKIEEKKKPVIQGEQARLTEQKKQQSLFHLISVLTATLNYQKVLDTALDLSGNILNADDNKPDRLVSAVLLFADGEGERARLGVGSARKFTPSDSRILLPGNQGLLAQVLETSEAASIQNISADPELKRVVALHTCNSGYCLPLRVGLETYGVMLFAHPEANYFTPERCEILKIIEEQAVIALQNARLYENLEEEKERMMDIQEEARKKLARDLHDGPTQSVAAIAMRVNFARRLLEKDLSGASDELEKIEDLARRTTKEIRHMLFTLRPLVLESQGLVAALEAMAEKMKETYGQHVVVLADEGSLPDIEASKQTVIFYIVEEAVNNARKHAQATRICVRLKTIENDLVLVEVEDDGVGFNVGAIDAFYDKRGSLGMVNMRERAELVNGILHIDSFEGKGTHIQVIIPITDKAAERLRSKP
jgi:signal transduction histidine kinase